MTLDLSSREADIKRLEKEGAREGEEVDRALKVKVEMEARVKRLEKEIKQKDEELEGQAREVDKERKKVTRVERELEAAKVSLVLKSLDLHVTGQPFFVYRRKMLLKKTKSSTTQSNVLVLNSTRSAAKSPTCAKN